MLPVSTLYLGVDPRLSGAIAVVNGDDRLIAVDDMPIRARGSGRVKHEVAAAAIAHLLRPTSKRSRIGSSSRLAHGLGGRW